MKITLVQSSPSEGGTEVTLERLDDLIGQGTGADFYFLPEMFASGQALDPSGIAQDMDGSIVNWLRHTSARLDAAVAGSLAIKESDHFYNRFCMAKPDGTVISYDKHHLFTYGGEKERFSCGEQAVTVEWRGIRFRLCVCYDLRFPVWLRNTDRYDALICVANWPKPRRDNWDLLLRARALENQCYVIGVNRVGDDPVCHYDGGTAFVDPYGNVQASCPDCTECECSGTIDKKLLDEFRAKFPVLEDADKFIIQ